MIIMFATAENIQKIINENSVNQTFIYPLHHELIKRNQIIAIIMYGASNSPQL